MSGDPERYNELFDGAGSTEPPVPMVDLAARSAGPRRSPARGGGRARVATGLVIALAVGVGGYTLGRHDGGSAQVPGIAAAVPAPSDTTPTSSFDLYLGEEIEGSRAGGAADPETGEFVVDVGGSMPASGRSAPEHFSPAESLSPKAGTAQLWVLDQSTVLTRQFVARLAHRLGVLGSVEGKDNAWVVGADGAPGGLVRVSADGTAGLYYQAPSIAEQGCGHQLPQAGLCLVDVSDPKSRDDAALVTATGFLTELLGAERTFEQTMIAVPDADTRQITLQETTDGKPTGLQVVITVNGGVVTAFSGSIAEWKPVRKVAVVSAREAVDRLNDLRFRSNTAFVDSGLGVLTGTGEPAVPELPDVTGPIIWPSTEIVITAARPGWSSHTLPDGTVLMLPSFYLEDENGDRHIVVSIAEEDLSLGGGY
ncbi:hypothetical protein D1871_11775 [Nakamurella silvestris]|nr:hypothetical protein D1871_11775 [Nakamurella silvestris]